MTQISVQGFKIDINHFETQISKNGRPFRLSGVSLVTNKPTVWIDKKLMHGTIYIFRYLDKDDDLYKGQDEFFSFEFCPKGNFICKL